MQPKLIRFTARNSLTQWIENAPVLDIPITSVHGARAVLALPGDMKGAINLFNLPSSFYNRNQATINVPVSHSEGVEAAHRWLVKWLANGSEGLIKLSSVRKGVTSKSKKITVDGVVYRHGRWRDEYTSEERKSHQLTVPASMIKLIGEDAYMTRGYLMRLVHERILGSGSWPHDIDGGTFFDGDRLWDELFEPLKQKYQALEAAQAVERDAQKARDEALRKTQLEAARARPPRPTADQLAATRQQQKAARLASLPVIRPAWIEWDESIETKDARGNKKFAKETFRDEGCEVRVSGQRVYVRFPDGEEMIKMRQSIRWPEVESDRSSQT